MVPRGQRRPLGVPGQRHPGLPELQHRLPPGPQFSPLNQAGGRGKAERWAEGGQGRRDDDPASPERVGDDQSARGTKHQTTLNRVLAVSDGPARLNGHCCGRVSFIDTGGGRHDCIIWIQSLGWLGPPASCVRPLARYLLTSASIRSGDSIRRQRRSCFAPSSIPSVRNVSIPSLYPPLLVADRGPHPVAYVCFKNRTSYDYTLSPFVGGALTLASWSAGDPAKF